MPAGVRQDTAQVLAPQCVAAWPGAARAGTISRRRAIAGTFPCARVGPDAAGMDSCARRGGRADRPLAVAARRGKRPQTGVTGRHRALTARPRGVIARIRGVIARIRGVIARLHAVIARLHAVIARRRAVRARLHAVIARLHAVIARLHAVIARLHAVIARLRAVITRRRAGIDLQPSRPPRCRRRPAERRRARPVVAAGTRGSRAGGVIIAPAAAR